MAKATVYSIVLAPELRDAFLAAAAACERPPAQVLRSLMREFIQRQQEGDAEPATDTDAATDAPDAASAENVTAVTDATDNAESSAINAEAAATSTDAAAAPNSAAEALPTTSDSAETKATASEAVS
jgi:hypothetical protein